MSDNYVQVECETPNSFMSNTDNSLNRLVIDYCKEVNSKELKEAKLLVKKNDASLAAIKSEFQKKKINHLHVLIGNQSAKLGFDIKKFSRFSQALLPFEIKRDAKYAKNIETWRQSNSVYNHHQHSSEEEELVIKQEENDNEPPQQIPESNINQFRQTHQEQQYRQISAQTEQQRYKQMKEAELRNQQKEFILKHQQLLQEQNIALQKQHLALQYQYQQLEQKEIEEFEQKEEKEKEKGEKGEEDDYELCE